MILIGINREGYVAEWNSKAVAMSNFKAEEVLGLHFAETLLTCDTQDFMEEKLRQIWSGQALPQFKLTFYTKCGNPRDLLISARRSVDEVILSAAIISPTAMLIDVDVNGLILEWDALAEAVMGFSQKEVQGYSFIEDILTYDMGDFVATQLNEAMAGEAVPAFSFPIYTKGGVRRDVSLCKIHPRFNAGKAIGALIVAEVDGLQELMQKQDFTQKLQESYAKFATETLSTCPPSMDFDNIFVTDVDKDSDNED